MAPVLGCIADDFTGATDLANMLVRGGMRTVQLIGVPGRETAVPEADAIVVALKSRTIPAAEATGQSLAALEWLREVGCCRFFFKYCSTFDSTDEGNIGPVAEALMEALGTGISIACPAFPENGRTVFNGHLFVGTELLSDSSMRDHPLTPMTDSNLVRVLQRQTARPVSLIGLASIEAGTVAAELEALEAGGGGIAILDAVHDRHLHMAGEGIAALPLVTGGSGIAIGLPGAYRRAGLLAEISPEAGDADSAGNLPRIGGGGAVLAGSCSTATLAQIAHFRATHPAFLLDALRLADGGDMVAEALEWAAALPADAPFLVYASQPAERVREIQHALGRAEAGTLIENAMADIARGLVAAGRRRLVVAGGETSGSVVSALGVTGLRIGAQIDPGVPATVSIGNAPVALALKSGNFGAPDFFVKALAAMP